MPVEAPPRKPRGRPSIPPEARLSAAVTVRLTNAAYDAAYARARLHRCSVAELLRKALLRAGRLPEPR